MRTSETITSIAPALHKAQSQMKDAKRDGDNPMFRSNYATLESVLDAVRGPLHANGLAVMQSPEGDGETLRIVTRIMHTSGEWIEGDFAMKPIPAKLDRSEAGARAITPQAMGSAVTYARRYALSSLLGLGSDDDDGNAASQTEKHAVAPQEDLGTFEDTVTDVRVANRKSATGDFQVFTVKTGQGHHLNTLDKDLAAKAKGFKGTGEAVIIESEPSKYGPKITAIMGKE